MKNLISIVIPAYNQAENLRHALQSILTQTYKVYEVIVVNDGSMDHTAEVIRQMEDTFKERGVRFVSISQTNQGAQHARNRGFREANGEFVIFWDADVVAHPHLLEKMYFALETNPEASYAYSSFIWGKKKFKLWEFDAEKLQQQPYIHSTTLVRTRHFPGWDTRIKRLQDWDVWLTMLQRGQRGVFVDDILFTVKTDRGTMSEWLPKVVYKLPWLPKVKQYQKAVEVVKKKHKLS